MVAWERNLAGAGFRADTRRPKADSIPAPTPDLGLSTDLPPRLSTNGRFTAASRQESDSAESGPGSGLAAAHTRFGLIAASRSRVPPARGCPSLCRPRPASQYGPESFRAGRARSPEDAGGHYWTELPPSTGTSAPVMKLASSEARNTATLATSSGRPMRPIGMAAPSDATFLARSTP